jgi:hypothetical protein
MNNIIKLIWNGRLSNVIIARLIKTVKPDSAENTDPADMVRRKCLAQLSIT